MPAKVEELRIGRSARSSRRSSGGFNGMFEIVAAANAGVSAGKRRPIWQMIA
jgi:hypothetical protein